jgi:hypothetical protein
MSGKIVKAGGAEPDEFEQSVAQELFNLEVLLMRQIIVLMIVLDNV